MLLSPWHDCITIFFFSKEAGKHICDSTLNWELELVKLSVDGPGNGHFTS